MRVVLADDSVLMIERLLEVLNLNSKVEIVGVFGDGKQALNAIKQLKPDLVIIDIQMPGLTGLEILNQIRIDDKTTKFMILTLYSSDHYQQLALKNGADYFFSKVDDFEKVSHVVESICH